MSMHASPEIAVVIDHASLSVNVDLVERCVRQTLARSGVSEAEVDVILTDRSLVLDLNQRFLNHDYPTDVLSFRLSEGEQLAGEVYVDLDTARERCSEFATSFEAEVCRYVVHGVLHLAGFEDHTDLLRAEMRSHEDAILTDVFGSTPG